MKISLGMFWSKLGSANWELVNELGTTTYNYSFQ